MHVGKYNAESLKQGCKRFNSITKTIHFANLGILFIYGGLFDGGGGICVRLSVFVCVCVCVGVCVGVCVCVCGKVK